MKNSTIANFAACLSLALALVISSPARTLAADESSMKMDHAAMQRCQEMKDKMDKMNADMKADDAELAEHVAQMKSATGEKKIEHMAAIITLMVQQRAAMNVRHAKMADEMSQHMMQHMQMGKESMSQCPMMNGMK